MKSIPYNDECSHTRVCNDGARLSVNISALPSLQRRDFTLLLIAFAHQICNSLGSKQFLLDPLILFLQFCELQVVIAFVFDCFARLGFSVSTFLKLDLHSLCWWGVVDINGLILDCSLAGITWSSSRCVGAGRGAVIQNDDLGLSLWGLGR